MPRNDVLKGRRPLALGAAALVLALSGPAAAALPKLTTEVAFPNLKFDRPVAMAYPDDGSNLLFVVEQHQARIQSFPNEHGHHATRSSSSSSPTRSTGATRRGCSAWPSTRSTRRTASSSSTTRPTTTADRPALGRLAVHASRRTTRARPTPRARSGSGSRPSDPFENHNGGCIAFGPDGYLYISLGDSGAADDPLTTGQNPNDWFGSILRIDVDHPVRRQALRHPHGQPPAPRPEGSPTGRPRSTASACGTSGSSASTARPARSGPATSARTSGRWSTSSRTAATTAGASSEGVPPVQPARQKADPRAKITPPIVEYPHRPNDDPDRKDDGKSITGGYVYRGKALPELVGVYVYGDFDTGRIWGLREQGRQGRRQRRADRPAKPKPS